MTNHHANWHTIFGTSRFTEGVPNDAHVISDVGPWDKYLSITNDVEWVVEQLFIQKNIIDGQRVFYYDSEDVLGEIIIQNRKFFAFGDSIKEE